MVEPLEESEEEAEKRIGVRGDFGERIFTEVEKVAEAEPDSKDSDLIALEFKSEERGVSISLIGLNLESFFL